MTTVWTSKPRTTKRCGRRGCEQAAHDGYDCCSPQCANFKKELGHADNLCAALGPSDLTDTYLLQIGNAMKAWDAAQRARRGIRLAATDAGIDKQAWLALLNGYGATSR